MKKAVYGLVIVLLVGVPVFLFREPLLTALGEFLIVSDPLEKADAIEILAGDEASRCPKAAEIFSQGWAPRILLTKGLYPHGLYQLRRYGIREKEGHERCAAVLQYLKVPKAAITVIDGHNQSTADEAYKIRDYLKKQKLKRLIVVTSNSHTRRGRLVFRRVLGDDGVTVLAQAAAPDYGFDSEQWWSRRGDMKTLLLEYQKLIFYALWYW